jgi:tetratricopeptide (TPR) repeat protein
MTDSTDSLQPHDPGHQPSSQDEDARPKASLEPMSEDQFRQHMRQAAHLLSRGNGRDAVPLLERCYALHPDDENVLINLGGAYILAERHHLAVPLLEKASELAPNNPAVWSNLAAAHLGKLVTASRARQDRALAAYNRVIDLEPDYPNVHYNMGLIYVDRRDWDAAHAAFSRAIESNPGDDDAHAMRKRVDEVRNRPPDAANN